MANLNVHASKDRDLKPLQEEGSAVTDARGRVIKIRELDAVQEARVFCAAGAEDAVNMPYMNMYVFPAARVEEIDGEKYAVPTNKLQINGMLSVLGKAGLNAVQEFMFQQMGEENTNQLDDNAAKN
ncbi:hypothetical protein [Serratia sp. M24T3]|uniref:hypothetical protein n=1 Tax=Serratia sp. M24T3 TaxID=932213 RepID=UPI00025BBA73|nr:hypothetical protein [Serratia sp. M24T3]EIC83374.1 hypothetical protein SPM24T3_17225 [Serratia sp. M24T3]